MCCRKRIKLYDFLKIFFIPQLRHFSSFSKASFPKCEGRKYAGGSRQPCLNSSVQVFANIHSVHFVHVKGYYSDNFLSKHVEWQLPMHSILFLRTMEKVTSSKKSMIFQLEKHKGSQMRLYVLCMQIFVALKKALPHCDILQKWGAKKTDRVYKPLLQIKS